MEIKFIPFRGSKPLKGFCPTTVITEADFDAASYAEKMKEQYSSYGCTSVVVEYSI